MTALWKTWLATARRRPRRTVLVEAETGQAMTAAELTEAAAAEGEPAWRGQVVPFCLPNGRAWLTRFLAIQRVGGIAAPIDPSMSGVALEETITRCRRLKLPRGRCCLKLTSGTTGQWQVVACRAAHLLADGRQVTRTMGLRAGDRNLASIPLGHSYGLGNLVLPLLQQGTSLVCASALVPRYLLEVIERYQVTVLPTVPAILRALASTRGVTRPPSLRLVISAGAPLTADVARQFHDRFGLRIHNFYGSSETGGICYDRRGQATLEGRSVGRPLDGVTVRLAPDGRVIVTSAAVAMPRGRYTLADLGAWTEHGELRLQGRRGAVANIGGRKVVPAEVENMLRGLTGIADAWVGVLCDRHGKDYLVAALETVRSRSSVETHLAERLPSWKRPRRYYLARRLPRTDRGKLDTAQLRAWLQV